MTIIINANQNSYLIPYGFLATVLMGPSLILSSLILNNHIWIHFANRLNIFNLPEKVSIMCKLCLHNLYF